MNVLYIGNRLSAHGKSPTGIEILGPLLEKRGHNLRYASSKKNKIVRLSQMLAATFRSRKWADVVLIDTYSTSNFWYAVAVSALCRRFKITYIPVLHGGNLPSRLVNSPSASGALFKNSAVNVAPSGYLQRAFADRGYNVKLIPNPVNLDNFPFKPRPEAAPNLLWVRALGPMSNPQMAVRVAALVAREHPSTRLVMVGPDPLDLSRDLRQLASQLGVQLDLRGGLSQKEWASLSAQSDIFINTSSVDNAPFSLIEAMALGLYVVSTDVGGIPFLADDMRDALLCGPGDDAAMARSIIKIIADPALRATLQKSAFEKSRRFSADAILPLWDEILAKPL